MQSRALQKIRSLISFFEWLPPLASRAVVGWVFIESGWGKLHSLEKVTEFFQSLGLPLPGFQAVMVAATEFGCGLCLVAGLLTRLAAVPLSVIMVVALMTAKKDDIKVWSDLFSVYEFLYIVVFSWLMIYGPGAVSLDRLFFGSHKRR